MRRVYPGDVCDGVRMCLTLCGTRLTPKKSSIAHWHDSRRRSRRRYLCSSSTSILVRWPTQGRSSPKFWSSVESSNRRGKGLYREFEDDGAFECVIDRHLVAYAKSEMTQSDESVWVPMLPDSVILEIDTRYKSEARSAVQEIEKLRAEASCHKMKPSKRGQKRGTRQIEPKQPSDSQKYNWNAIRLTWQNGPQMPRWQVGLRRRGRTLPRLLWHKKPRSDLPWV